jgi:hypothetical protein
MYMYLLWINRQVHKNREPLIPEPSLPSLY